MPAADLTDSLSGEHQGGSEVTMRLQEFFDIGLHQEHS